jgi:hypothetical protein
MPTSRPYGWRCTIASLGELPVRNHRHANSVVLATKIKEFAMGRYLLLWLLGVPIPILLLIWAFGGLS